MAVVSLAIGIAATTTIYAIVDAMLIRDVTAHDPARLVMFDAVSYPTYRDLSASGIFEDVAAGSQCGPTSWRDGNYVRTLIADCLSANFFEVVGGQAALGRVFTKNEAAPERNPRIVVIGHRFWRRLGGDREILGRVLMLNETPFVIIGVLPPDYRAIQGFGISPDVYVPYSTVFQPSLFDRWASSRDRMLPIARLARGRTREQSELLLRSVLDRIRQQYSAPAAVAAHSSALTPVAGLAKYGVEGADRSILRFSELAGVIAAFVLLIACANVAGLLLARGLFRGPEIALRRALGATRAHLLRQLLIEAALIAAGGTTIGLALTYWIAQWLATIDVPVQDVTLRFTYAPEWRIALMGSVAGTLAAVGCGLIPAFAASRTSDTAIIRAGRQTTSRVGMRAAAVTGQVSLSVILVSAAFLFARNALVVVTADPGFDVAHVLWFDVAIDRRLPLDRQIAIRDRIDRSLVSYPGVEAVSWAWYLPFQVVFPQPTLRTADGQTITAIEQGIGPGYLHTMGIPLVAGREFTREDLNPRHPGSPAPVIINEALASVLFPARTPIGDRLIRDGVAGSNARIEIVGVSRNTSFRIPGEVPPPLLQSLSSYTPSFVVRTTPPVASLVADLSKLIDATFPGTTGGHFTMAERTEQSTFPPRAAALLLMILAAVGLGLALIGLCGMTMSNVARRTPEVGIRVALGATTQQVIWLMMADGFRLVGLALGIGLIGTAVLNRTLRVFVVATAEPLDATAITTTLMTVLVTAGVSLWLSSRRASRVNPANALRAE